MKLGINPKTYKVGQMLHAPGESFLIGHQTLRVIIATLFRPAVVHNNILVASVQITVVDHFECSSAN